MARNSASRPDSFTLVELLVVIVIVTILASLSLPAIFSLMRSSSLTTGGSRLVDQLTLARETAMTKNCNVEFRFYELPDPATPSANAPTIYRAFQCFSLDNNGAQTNAITKVNFLPNGIQLVNNVTVSSLLPATPTNPPYLVSGTVSGNSLGTYPPVSYNYMAFHFKPNGSTDLNPSTTSRWFISLANQSDSVTGSNPLPGNFLTVQVDAQTGRVRSFRPN